jgi:RNA polymerase sigma-70 factor, ECF subfamily
VFRIEKPPRLRLVPQDTPLDSACGDAASRVADLEVERDVALVSALRRSDSAAPETLFDAHAPRIERVLYRILGPQVELADALNTTFCRALDHIQDLYEPRGLRHWLTAIAVNVAREQLRSSRRRGWLEYRASEALPDWPSHAATDELLAARAAVTELFAVLAQMPEEERVAFSLRRLEELPNDEVATLLKVSLATAKRRIARANERFSLLARRMPELCHWVECSESASTSCAREVAQ